MEYYDDYRPVGRPASATVRWFAQQLTRVTSPRAAAAEIGISESTLTRVLAGLPISSTTEAAVEHARVLHARELLDPPR